MIKWTNGLVVVIALILALTTSHAQTVTSTISGVTADPSGALLPGVSITARNSGIDSTRVVVTDQLGRYSISGLAPGVYQVRAELPGFRSAVREEVVASVAGTSVVDFRMELGVLSSEVNVVAGESNDSLLEPAKTELSRVVDLREIESLPNIGRNFVDFVKLSSGVVSGRENVGGGSFKEPDVGVGSAAAPRLAFGGQTEMNTMIQVDGADNIQTFTGLPRATPSQEAASEFRILNSTYLSEYGRALGGFVNIVTKSGTKDMHGSLYYFGMNDNLNARSFLNPPDANVLRQNQFGVTLGGPIRRARTFFFGNYEGQRRAESNQFSSLIQDNLAALNTLRSRFNLKPETVHQVRTNDYDQFFAKFDGSVGDRHQLSLRQNFLSSDTRNFLGGGGRASPASSTARDNQTRDVAIVANGMSVISSRLVNEARLQWARRTFHLGSVSQEPDMQVSNLLTTGKSTSDPDYYREDRLQLTDNVSYARGAHQLKAGFDFNTLRDDSRWEAFFPASIVFPSLAALLNFTPASTSGPVVFFWPTLASASTHPGFPLPFSNAVPQEWQEDTHHQLKHASYGFFMQDQWNVTSKVVLVYGARYDFETYPRRYLSRRDMNNVQPRLGLAYNYRSGSVVRLGYGVFHDRLAGSVGQVFTRAEWGSRGAEQNASLLFPDIAPIAGRFRLMNVVGPAATSAAIALLTTGRVPASGAAPLAVSTSSVLQTPYSRQVSVQVVQEIGLGIAVSASYLWVRASQLMGETPNLNAVQSGTLPSGKPLVSGRRFPELGMFAVTNNVGSSAYHGATLEIRKRLSRGISLHGNYTYSKTMTNVDATANLADIPESPGVEERFLSRQHLGHRLAASFIVEAPKSVKVLRNFRLSSFLSIESGRPFNVFAGMDVNGDGNPLSDRPGLLGRNSLLGPGYATVDMRIGRDFYIKDRKTQISFDAFNLLNRRNIKDLNTVWGGPDVNVMPIPSFNTPREAFNSRKVQLGAKVVF